MTKTIYRIFIGILIFSPLAFGTVEQWSLTFMETASLLALCLVFLRKVRHKSLSFYEIPGIVPLMLFLAYALLQLVPLPAVIIKLLSPGAYSLYQKTVWIESPGAWSPLSINTRATLLEFFRMASYAAFYVLTIELLAKKDHLKKTVLLVIAFSAVLAFFGIIQHFVSNNKIFWFRELTQGGVPFGPYVNRNHYAGLMGMIFPIALGVFLCYRPAKTYGSFREKLLGVFSQKMTNRHVLFGFSAILIATSVFVSLSRGGIISLSISMIFAGTLFVAREKYKRIGIFIILTCILILYSVGWFGWSRIFERFEQIRDIQGEISELRVEIWKDSLNMIKDFPVTGTGFGSFISIYQKYRTISVPGIVDHAHNDYLELLSDGGIIGFLLMGWFLAAVLYRSVKIFLKRQEKYSIYLFVGIITGMVSILIHSVTDFNLHIGANGLYFSFLTGLAVSASHTRLRDGLVETYLIRTKPRFIKQAGLFAAAVLICSVIVNIGVLTGRFNYSLIKNSRLDINTKPEDLARIRDISYRASSYDPLEADYHYTIANSEWFSHNKPAALDHYKKAVRLVPSNGEYIQALGLAMSYIQRPEAADTLLNAGIDMDGMNPVRYKRYGSWLLSQGKLEKGISSIRKAISLEPKKTREYVTILILYGFKDREIRAAIPDLVEPHILFADYLQRTGKDDLAAEEYRDVLNYVKNEKEINPSYFYQVYQYYVNKGRPEDALEVMKKAVEALPGDVNICLNAAAAYEKAGIKYRAVEEYRRALVMDPKNETARKKLAGLK